jgi:hypothetical protein
VSSAAAIPLYLADSAAIALQQILGPLTEVVAIAGSVRRRCSIVHDIEVVVIPKIGEQTRPGELTPSRVDWLAELMAIVEQNAHPVLFKPMAVAGQRKSPWGPRTKLLLLRHQGRDIKVDLRITSRARFGSIFAICTGDAEFSRLLVTPRHVGGAMPNGLSQADGALQQIVGSDANGKPQWEPLYTPDEESYFGALGLPVLRPEQRTRAALKKLLAAGGNPSPVEA